MKTDPKIREKVKQLLKTRKVIFGEDSTDAVEYIKRKLCLDCSNSAVRRALCSLIFKGEIKRARLNRQMGTLDAMSGDSGVIFYVEGASGKEFPKEFLTWVNARKEGVAA